MNKKIIAGVAIVAIMLSFKPARQHTIDNNKKAAYKDLADTNWKGIVWEPFNDDWSSAGTSSDAQEIADCGIKWARTWVTASDSFSSVDAMVQQCKSKNIQIVLCYNKTNPRHDLGDAAQQQEQVKRLKSFVQRYKKEVHYWEIHNEANLNHYWNVGKEEGRGGNDPNSLYNKGVHNYVIWLRLAYTAIKQVDPKATILLGGVSNWIMEDFMDRLTIEKAYNYFDEVAFHPYAVNSNPVPDECISRLKSFQQKMAAWPAPKNDMPIWITEIGFHTGTISSPGIVKDETIKAAYLEETMKKLIANLHYSRPIFWYIFHEKDASKTWFSLVKKYAHEGTVKTELLPAYHAFKNMDKSWDHYARHSKP